MGPRFGILGSLRVLENGRPVDLGSRKQQIVLAALLCHANSLVSFDSLVEALWDDAPPRTARKNIQVYVSALRRLVGGGAERISFRNGGYVLHATPAELDSLGFEQQARAGALADALGLWHGPVLDGFRGVPLIEAAALRLEQRFLAVFEDWAEREIAAGGGAKVIEHVSEVAQRHPLRERLRMTQMTALCQAGRRSEALAVYDELRQSLARELGLSPSPALAGFYQSLLCEQGPAASPSSAPPARRTVPPSLLPWDLPTFTGRAAATGQLADALTSGGNRLAVVTGPLGAGKTAIAVHVAHRLGDHFPDGRVFVRLRGEDGSPRPLEDVVSRLLPAAPPGSPSEARRAWQLWLAGRRALVIVDDARRESEVRPLLPESGDSAVIVTARSRLAGLDAAYRLWISSFAMHEAVGLLGRLIGAERVTADRPSAELIVTAAGWLPLGVRLVAERLALLHHVPLREYAARMAGTRALLDELTAGDVAIRARLAEAIGELPEPAHRAVPRLGMLPEPVFTLQQAAAVLGADEGTAVRVLESLLEASIITVPRVERLAHTVRYEIPVLPYAYAREMAARSTPLTDIEPALGQSHTARSYASTEMA
ncbi:BTAD domain-containing putative transcriptional regulator [Actinoallomurus sp. NPDC052308]|uniref:AfsR/SARP family transcriptional regulator n=1 Tax=Actinoallomurus sp. NPDC052308 TaxID=3155530 RepID=UPI003439A398